MSDSVESILERLRRHFAVRNDAELARILHISQSTISTWKYREKVPDNITRILAGQGSLALGAGPVYWGALENAAFGIALVRYCRLYAATVSDADYRSLFAVASRPSEFWTLFRQAQKELSNELSQSADGKPDGAFALILNDDFSNPDLAKANAEKTIREGRSEVEWDDGSVTIL